MIRLSPPKIIHTPILVILILHNHCIVRANLPDSKSIDIKVNSTIIDSLSAIDQIDLQHKNDNESTKSDPVPLPSRFHYYDLDGNGFLTLKELAKVTGTSRKDARLPFGAADADGNKRITFEEFNNAPWLFGALPHHMELSPPPPFPLSSSANHTIPNGPRPRSNTQRRNGRRKQPKKKIRRQHQRKLRKKLASPTATKSKKPKSSAILD